MLKKFRFGFDIWGFLLFILIMLPNIFWFMIPAPNDILRGESTLPVLDSIASVCQVLLIAALCLLIRKDRGKFRIGSKWIVLSALSCFCYYMGWLGYYQGYTNAGVILLLFLFPCLAFIFYELEQKNWFAIIPTIAFSLLHGVHAIINFII